VLACRIIRQVGGFPATATIESGGSARVASRFFLLLFDFGPPSVDCTTHLFAPLFGSHISGRSFSAFPSQLGKMLTEGRHLSAILPHTFVGDTQRICKSMILRRLEFLTYTADMYRIVLVKQ